MTSGQTRARLSATDLVEAYAPGDFVLATRERTLLATGAAGVLTGPDPVPLAEAAVGTAVVGVLPFDTRPGATSPCHLVLPDTLHVAGAAHPGVNALPRAFTPEPLSVLPVPAPALHRDAVARAVAALGERGLRKVVLARALDLSFGKPVDPAGVLRNLVKDNRRGYTFAAGLPGGRTLVGSTPELLLARSGRRVVSYPHAGSMPRSDDPAADRASAEALLASRKDHVEHAVLSEYIVEMLRPFCRKLDVPAGPELVGTPAVWHLGTTITGELADPDVTALHLAGALHPSPAICGTPTAGARDLVCELEPFDRAYYAGAVGWTDASGDGEWAVAVRCGEISGTTMRLYAGGGIVPASDPQAELDETTAKFRVLLNAMGLRLSS
jgi:isochorismate synthase